MSWRDPNKAEVIVVNCGFNYLVCWILLFSVWCWKIGGVGIVSVMTQSRSEAGIGSEFRSEWSYQILEEGNGIGLGFNVCVAPTHMICRYVL